MPPAMPAMPLQVIAVVTLRLCSAPAGVHDRCKGLRCCICSGVELQVFHSVAFFSSLSHHLVVMIAKEAMPMQF